MWHFLVAGDVGTHSLWSPTISFNYQEEGWGGVMLNKGVSVWADDNSHFWERGRPCTVVASVSFRSSALPQTHFLVKSISAHQEFTIDS